MVSNEYAKRTLMNMRASGELSSWDLSDESGSITLVAFNLNSRLLSNKLMKDKMFEFVNLTVRHASDVYKTLPHEFELLCNNATRVEEIHLPLIHIQLQYNPIHLNQVDTIQLNSIIDIQVKVLRDFRISTGQREEKIWFRRDLHIVQDETQIRMTLWNNQAQIINRNMAGLNMKLKNVKVSWFDGSRVLTIMANTQIIII